MMYGKGSTSPRTGKHTSHFLRYFEGYSEVRSITPDGNLKVDMVYTASYWVHALTDKQWIRRKLFFLVMTVLIIALYLVAAFVPMGGAYARMVMLPGGITAALLVFLASYTVSYLFCPRRMTVYVCNRNHTAMRNWPFMSAVGLTATGLMSAAYAFRGEGDWIIRIVFCVVCYFVAAAIAFALYRIENKTEYYEEENENSYSAYPSC